MFAQALNTLRWCWNNAQYFDEERNTYKTFEDWVNNTPLSEVLTELADFEEVH